ncbi:Superoxide dismutase [Mn], mitochondrial [Orbilia oligospora]|uniref:Superoxide dismutase n=2 Tax=Orbilia oligospora TaxID=2813651 RepID=A0A6G1MC57_ORBOL|nr:Superoxide dismutase [Mn], mitochondrial [Orbilia oligospora]KAF3222414.1 Superoxide dismutase [Mn], mitochondrial [Orbilia oligospora]KAF3223306.1 Superoxide dismutase [Mn], mitochondrial [Orbilia oligospora]KAF3253535.1 Superoxide dismutase [Mn], mitochondrial [Orbilia oligospora]
MTEIYTLPPLPYAYDALEPYISSQIMELHHSKHHATYIANLNKALSSPKASNTQSLIHFNGGGHINHSIFWNNLTPASSEDAKQSAAPSLTQAIERDFGFFSDFKTKFNAALLGIQGSGWGWLIVNDGKLDIITTKDQDTVPEGTTAIFGVDMWEHAYYLQYLNGKAAYVENIWNIINWGYAERRFTGHADGEFRELKAML